MFDLEIFLERQKDITQRAFGPGSRMNAILDHMLKEMGEVRDSGGETLEWIDLVILALDGAVRSCDGDIELVLNSLEYKLMVIHRRKYPDWRTANPDKAIEHIRGIED